MQRTRSGGVFLCVTLLLTLAAHPRRVPANASASAAQATAYGALPLSFEPNVGQTAAAGVDFLAHGSGYTLALTADAAALGLRRGTLPRTDAAPPADAVGLQLHLLGATPRARGEGEAALPGTANYFLGNQPAAWRTQIPTYARVRYHDVYPGVDLVYYGRQGQLEYDFELAPGTDPARVRLGFAGSAGLALDAQGALVLQLAGGTVRQPPPQLYQEVNGERRAVRGGYRLAPGNQVGFAVGAYDPSRPLVIDPVLVYSTYLGGSSLDEGLGIAVDGAGNAYVTGFADSTDFPTQTPLQAVRGGSGPGITAFVAKLNASGSALVYATYLGGSGGDAGNAIALDSAGNAYVTGGTASPDFPTQNPLQAANHSTASRDSNAFVAKLNADGSALVYSTYLGGSGSDHLHPTDRGSGIAVDGAGNAYVTGHTESPDFPTQNPLQSALGGSGPGVSNAFVAKLNAGGSALIYATYLGGSGHDEGRGIAVDGAGNAYVTGRTDSPDFPTQNPLQAANHHPASRSATASSSAFVAKLNADGSALVYATYLGGSQNGNNNVAAEDDGSGIAVDGAGNAYVTGGTQSRDFPTTVGALQTSLASDYGNAFVAKLNPDGSALVYATYLGGSRGDGGAAIAVDGAGNAYVTGSTSSLDFPTQTPLQAANNSPDSAGSNAFVAELNADGGALIYATYLGGSVIDEGHGIAVDGAGNAYVTGLAFSTDFPTQAPLQAARGGSGPAVSNAFVTKIAVGGTSNRAGGPQPGPGNGPPAAAPAADRARP